MSRRLRRIAVAFMVLATASMSAAPETHRNFVACPIVRDTSTVPCWLAEHKGELYFLTLQTDVSAPVNTPQLGHRVLVEGVVSNEPRICGGVVLKPIVLSVLPELDNSCSTVLPAEERYNLTFEPPRPPGPSRGRLAFDPPSQTAAARPAADTATGPRTFAVQFDFDGLVAFRHAQVLQQIQAFALKSKATRIEITAYRAASLLSDDTVFSEREDIGQRRAQQLASLLKDSGVSATIDIAWRDAARPDGVNDAALRRADVTVR
jgi:outer membrane protein OmpA-like peptidoglycan-associated protein